MPIQLSFMERMMLITLNQGPGVFLDSIGALAFPTLATANKLGMFEVLSDGPLTAAEVAEKIGANERGVFFLARSPGGTGLSQATDRKVTS